MRSPVAVLALVLGACAAAIACGDLKGADPQSPEGVDASADSPAAPGASEASSRSGPGPHGSLPTGYCCTKDTECRYRHCVAVDALGQPSGPKMCVDECYDSLFCTRPDLTFTCQGASTPGSPGLCIPPSGGFTCLDPAKYIRGASEIGACCNAGAGGTNDGTAASACEGNTCMSSADNPLICTHRCASQGDCPGGYVCDRFGTSKACLKTASPYTCAP